MDASTGSGSGISIPLIEGGLTLIAVALSFAWPRIGSGGFSWIEWKFGRLARRKRPAVIVVGASALLLRLAILPWFPIPLPVIPDDFSFLLAADTFAHGRLTNPTPAMWIHFESIHIDMLPTYMSMYFPGPGLVLAAGKVFFGHPWYGLLITNALMCAAICWMLQAWIPPTWAFLGGMLAVLRIGLFSFWINTYTGGGALAALGGALVLGAFPRFIRKPRFGYAMTMATGIVILAYSRPYEGMLLCLPVAGVLGHWLFTAENRPSTPILLQRTVFPLIVLIAAAGWLGLYDFRVFGRPLTLPYTVNRATYAIAPYYVWQSPRHEPAYRHEELRRFYHSDELTLYNNVHSRSRFVPQTLLKAVATLLFYAGLSLIPPLFMMRRVLKDRRIRFLVCCLLILTAGMVIEIYVAPYYVSPFTAAFYAIGLQGMRHLWQWSPGGRSAGMTIVRLSVAVCLIMAGLRPFDHQLNFPVQEKPPIGWVAWWFGPDHFGAERTKIEEKVEQLPGKHLLVVRYSDIHDPRFDWLTSSTDIEDPWANLGSGDEFS